MEILKGKYNALLAREKKAEIYFDNPLIDQAKKDSYMKDFLKIIEGLSRLITRYKELTGEEMPNEVCLNGFQ